MPVGLRRAVPGRVPISALLALLLASSPSWADEHGERRLLYARSNLGLGGLGVRQSNPEGPSTGTSGSGVHGELLLGARALPWLAIAGGAAGFYAWAPRARAADGTRTPLGQSQHIKLLQLHVDVAPRSLHDVHFSAGAGAAWLGDEGRDPGARSRRRGVVLSLEIGRAHV